MTSHDRHLASVTLAALIVMGALAFAPFAVLVSVIGLILLAFVILGVFLIFHAVTRPLDDVDEWCSKVDLELDREREARRLQRQMLRDGGLPPVLESGSGFRVR